MYLVIMHPDNKNYREIRLNHLNDEVLGMLKCRKSAIDMKVDQPILLPAPDCEFEDD